MIGGGDRGNRDAEGGANMSADGSALPLVKIISTGGTIANTAGGRVAIEEVIREIREAGELARYEIEEVCRVGAETFTPEHWLLIGRAVDKALRGQPEIAGLLVTHGTFTSEETAYFLNLTVRTEKPVVVVCSQKPHGTLGNDGDFNFVCATRVALDPQAPGQGVLLVMNETILPGREVLKASGRAGGFKTRAIGPLGYVDKDAVVFYQSPRRRHTHRSEFDVAEIESLPRVDIVYAYPGADGVAIRALVEEGKAEGIVVAGLTYSGVPAVEQKEELQRAIARGIPVVLTSRGGENRTPIPRADTKPPYTPKPEDYTYVYGDNLSPQKARVLLAVALTRTRERDELQRIFNEY
jgi:L-asparaginase